MNTLTDQDFADAAALLGCEVAAIRAVCQVEAPRGGFNPDRSPVTLFEGHIFHRLTDGVHDAAAPDLSYPRWTRNFYGRTWQQEKARLSRACDLDREAALKSASWGRFQIMGMNFALCGFNELQQFINAMYDSEREQLMAFCQFVRSARLEWPLRNRDWAAFARGYNGPAYAANDYDTKLAGAYARYKAAGDGLPIANPPHAPT